MRTSRGPKGRHFVQSALDPRPYALTGMAINFRPSGLFERAEDLSKPPTSPLLSRAWLRRSRDRLPGACSSRRA